MKLLNFYEEVIKLGIDRDIRGKNKKINYFPDTALLYGDPETEVKKILVGIDIETPELLLADRLRSKKGLDLVLTHHPEGKAYAALYQVMQLQVDMLVKFGFPEAAAQDFLTERKREIERRILPQNHMRPVDTARILDMPFMCAHTPADNHVFCFIQDLLNKEKPKNLGEIIKILENVSEYKEACQYGAGPQIILGSPKRPVGKVFVEMTGGTEGHKDVYDKLSKCGVRTLVCMHLSEEHFKKVKDLNLNVVIAGHISSDTLGLNLLLDRLEKKAGERFETVDCSGFRRFRRN